MENSDKDKRILQLIRMRGPLLPIHITKEIGWDTILIGAALSDLSRKGHIKISNTKIGGSPVYYVSGQEYKLQNLYKYLHEKEQKAFDKLKENKVLRDIELEPVIRVALRNIKDFAKPLEVTLNENREIFWKWYLIDNKEAEQLIRLILKKYVPTKEPTKEEEKEPKREIIEQKQEGRKGEKQKKLEGIKEELEEEQKEEKDKQEIEEKSPFLNKIKRFFEKNNIEILEQNIVRKTSDAEFIIRVPSAIGSVRYFCKARSKKKFNDSDLSNVYVQGETKKLPVLFLITGELTKKAESMLDEQFKNINVKSI